MNLPAVFERKLFIPFYGLLAGAVFFGSTGYGIHDQQEHYNSELNEAQTLQQLKARVAALEIEWMKNDPDMYNSRGQLRMTQRQLEAMNALRAP